MEWITTTGKRVSRALFSNRPAQSAVRRAAHRGLLPHAVYRRILPVGPHPVATPAGNTVTYVADERDTMARAVVWPTGWESTSLEVFSRLARQARGVLDVGAFTGFYTLVAAADSDAEVITFEPNPTILPNLRRNVEVNGFGGRVRIMPLAVSDRPGTATLTVPSHDPTSAAIGEAGDGVAVEVVTLDQAVGAFPVDLVKMDVEGLEEAALQGGEKTIRANLPDLIVELLTEESFAGVTTLLRSWGYEEVRHLGSRGSVATTRRVDEPGHANFHFVRPEGLPA